MNLNRPLERLLRSAGSAAYCIEPDDHYHLGSELIV